MVNGATIVKGTNDKPVASDALIDAIKSLDRMDGQLFIGYPIIGTAESKTTIDALYVSPTKGLIVFDLIEGGDLANYQQRQDDAANGLESRLKLHRDLVHKRDLKIPVFAMSFAPGVPSSSLPSDSDYPVANPDTIQVALADVTWEPSDYTIYQRALSAVQNISTIRRSRSPRAASEPDSRGARIQKLEDSISTLDNLQSRAVIETVNGVQRIRGLAGSGKTIVLALKTAYLHAQHPEWRIAVTFNTRSLKGHFRRLINNFSVEQAGQEPNWSNVRIINAWGAPGSPDRDGIYHEFCRLHQVPYHDFRSAKAEFGSQDAFQGACAQALASAQEQQPVYDVILVDEAQDFPPEFLRMCYALLDQNKRLVYAYDELQNLSGSGLPSTEEIFGLDADGNAVVSFDHDAHNGMPRRDIILEKCYRNSRPVLVTAHALGFGIYREPVELGRPGLVQMFDQPDLWTDIGYHVKHGKLVPGKDVVLERTSKTSPSFLEQHSNIDDLVLFETFDSMQEQNEWLTSKIRENLEADELQYDDIVVINPNPLTTRDNLGPVRRRLLDIGILTHIAGVDTDPDVFFNTGSESITFTGIFRAKGNEAAMVYIVNAHESSNGTWNLARSRNRLFTAITRSKAWVRVTGVGSPMRALTAEFDRIKAHNFELAFRYPTVAEREQLRIVHRDVSEGEAKKLRDRQHDLRELISELEAGKIYPEDLDEDILARLQSLLQGRPRT